jgi:hypothetical protein
MKFISSLGDGAGRDARVAILLLLSLAILTTVALLPPLAEPRAFKTFADGRAVLGIPHFYNVVSNLPLLAVGLWGLHVARRESAPWLFLFLAVSLTAIGSSYYHLAPETGRLVWDRLPMSMGFMALVCAVLAERVSEKAGLRLLVPLMLAGAASVLYWRWSALGGAEDIVPYAAVQYGAVAMVLVIALLFPSRHPRGGDLFVALGLYGAAKLAEMLDAPIYALGGIVSGHTAKHLLAALAVGWLARMLRLRRR